MPPVPLRALLKKVKWHKNWKKDVVFGLVWGWEALFCCEEMRRKLTEKFCAVCALFLGGSTHTISTATVCECGDLEKKTRLVSQK